jgi:single-stranded-DNA-specific exonuclease
MLKSKTRWIVRHSNESTAKKLANELNISEILASLLLNRGITDRDEARRFLFDEGESFHDPFLFPDMKKAVERIQQAVHLQEKILVYGDYDADGVSSTVIMMTVLRDLGANVEYYIPDRFTEGYGPNEQAFRLAAEQGVKLIITVDTGIAAVNEIRLANELGMDVILTDHHEPGPVLPDALAIIHPKIPNCPYPFSDLAGVGVAFKLAHALYGEAPTHLLDIAVIGTIADLVPLHGENRSIAKEGIKRLKLSTRPGIQALLKVAKVNQSSLDEETIGFVIGPRINAAGRLAHANIAVELLLCTDDNIAYEQAKAIDELNKERQGIVNEITKEAVQMVEEMFPPEENDVLVIGKENWNAGVIGIVASRLVEKFYRPVIVLSYDRETGLAKGSARSIIGFDLFQNLSACRDLLPHFGGHPMAAGMTLAIEDVDKLRMRLNELAKEQLTEKDFIPLTEVDAEIRLDSVSLQTIEELLLLAPFGIENPKPKVLIKDVSLDTIRKIGADQSHLKVVLSYNQHTLDGVGFGFGELADHISPLAKVSVIGELSINEWNQIRKPQMMLHDLCVNEWQLFDVRGINMDQWKPKIPADEHVVILFREESSTFTSKYSDLNIKVILTEEDAKRMNITGKAVVLFDLPTSPTVLEALLQGKSPHRIYAHFFQKDSQYFRTIPTREHFKWYYAFLAKKGGFDLKRYGDELAKYRGWSKETIDFMSQVFFELDFVTIKDGFISLNPIKVKRDLSESKTYQQLLTMFQLEQDLLYSSYRDLKRWFDKRIESSVKNEEEIEAWI